MNVLKYMAEQKAKIRQRHLGEEFFFQCEKDKNSPVKLGESRPAEDILREIDAMTGLNTAQRAFFSHVGNKNNYAV